MSSGLLLIMLLVLGWFTYDKYNEHVDDINTLTRSSVMNAKESIIGILQNHKRILQSFVHYNRDEIIRLINKPDDSELHLILEKKLRSLLPDLFTFNIATQKREFLYDDLEGFIGQLCIDDIKEFTQINKHNKRVHPNNILYHYDEVTTIEVDNKEFIVFASFSLTSIVESLRLATQYDQTIYLIHEEQNNLIEISTDGGRDKLHSRDILQLTQDELDHITLRQKIPGTSWTIVNIEDSSQNRSKLISLLVPSAIIFFIIFLATLLTRQKMLEHLSELDTLTNELVEKNHNIMILNEKLKDLSITDPLTGIYSRRYFDQQFEKEWHRAIRSQSAISILMIDIDKFKQYNDFYGHVQGDECLIAVAKLLEGTFNRNNEFVARFGGEEFVALVNDDSENSKKLAEKIHNKLAASALPHLESEAGIITVSIGIASTVPAVNERPLTLLEKADIALYQAKNGGRNQSCVFDKKSLR